MLSEERLDRLEYQAERTGRLFKFEVAPLIATARQHRELRRLVEAVGPFPVEPVDRDGWSYCHHCDAATDGGKPHLDTCPGVALGAWLAEHGGDA